MSNSIMRDKAKDFAKNIVFLCRNMKTEHKEMVLVNQLLRSGTSIGANLHEAQYAQGTKDFISKLEIALKECNESEYWIDLLYETSSISKTEFDNFRNCVDCKSKRTLFLRAVCVYYDKTGMCVYYDNSFIAIKQ